MKNKSKKIKEMLTIFSVTIFMVTSGLILLPSVEANTINVPTDYPTIQDAIDNANPGDTIIVASNTYYENKINIDKSLSIIGEDKNNTILDVEGMDYGFEITADYGITISGFKIINYANSGVWFHGTGVGSNSRISNNIFDPMISSIYGVRATYHHICDVEVINNEMYSVGVIAYRYSCSNWNISNNIIDLGNRNFHAIRAGGFDFIIKNNVITNSSHAIYASFNTAADWWIESNILFNNENGIELMGYNHQIHCNKIEQNKCGIVLKSVHESTIQENKILNNSDYGLKLLNIKNSTSINNLIFHNLFLNNSENAYDEGINRWDNDYPSGGNYWCDYTVTDEDSNGLGDIPYEIPGGENQDSYPLCSNKAKITQVSFKIGRINATIRTCTNRGDCSILVDGFILSGYETLEELPAWTTTSMETPFILGFGEVDIIVKACEETKTYSRLLLGPFFIDV